MIERGRYKKIDRSERKCDICSSGELGDEIHFVWGCKTLEHVRKECIQESISKAKEIHGSNNEDIFKYVMTDNKMTNLAKFCWKASTV